MPLSPGLSTGTYENRDIVNAGILLVEPIRVGVLAADGVTEINAIFPQAGMNEIRRLNVPSFTPSKPIHLIVPPFDWYRGPSWFVQIFMPNTTMENTFNIFMEHPLVDMQHHGWGFWGFIFNPKAERVPGTVYNPMDFITPDDINFRVTPGGWMPIVSAYNT